MNFNHQVEQEDAGIELTPLIDVVFLLLIFFMISTTFTKESQLNINLPKSSTEQDVMLSSTIELHIGEDGQIGIKAEKDKQARLLSSSNRAVLVTALNKFKSTENLAIIIRADQKATHASVVKVLDVLAQLQMNQISFATEKISP